MIEIINLNKTIKTTKHTHTKILEDINLKIEQGDFVGVIGESGAGKSSFLRSINLLDRPSSGEIIIDKQNILFFNEKELLSLRRNIGMIFQSFCLLSTKNVEQNISLPMKLQKLDATTIKNKVNEFRLQWNTFPEACVCLFVSQMMTRNVNFMVNNCPKLWLRQMNNTKRRQ